ncbi:MAG TPA: Ldh family oxidoreductase [Blastocatellia bacterium]
MRNGDSIISEPELRAFCEAVFMTLGVESADAQVWADALMEASLRGIDSHGVLVLPMYAAMIEAGGIVASSRIETIYDGGATVLLDGKGGIGFVISARAMDLALERAASFGISFITVRNSNHFGAAGYYAMKSLPRDMVGIALTNASPALPAWGGKTRVIGSNAMAVAVPSGRKFPIVYDIAIGAAAGAKVFLMGQKGKAIPDDWMIDKEGRPTNDPGALFDGGLILPFGGHKGYGLGIILDVLSGVISGGLFSTQVPGFAQDMAKPLGACHTFMAIDVSRFLPVDEFKSRVDEMVRNIKASSPVEGIERVYLPGERGFLTREDRLKNGIPLHRKLAQDLCTLAARLSIHQPLAT